MAAAITHIITADKIFNKYFSDKDKRSFFIGTSFPDIRYLASIDREKTHFKGLNLNNLQQESAFEAGFQFHSLVDDLGGNVFASLKIDHLFPQSPYLGQAIKIYVDQMLYDKINNWPQFISYFEEVLPEELNFGIPSERIKRWHRILQKYFSVKPNKNSIKIFMADMDRPKEMYEEIMMVQQKITEDPKLKSIMDDLSNQFDSLMDQSDNIQ